MRVLCDHTNASNSITANQRYVSYFRHWNASSLSIRPRRARSQVAERNADYAEITRKIAFPMGRTLKSHDYVFWCGDFNYRLDCDREELRDALRQPGGQDAAALGAWLEHDQLRQQQQLGAVFGGFREGQITFPPTYKYDLFSSDYDTSEKQRAPAWTDRVLWRRRQTQQGVACGAGGAGDLAASDYGRLRHYGRAELKQSDHRPVIAIVDVELARIDAERRERVFGEVIGDLGPPDATIVVRVSASRRRHEFHEFDRSVTE